MSVRKFRLHDPLAAERALERVERVRRIGARMIDAASQRVAGERSWFVLQVRLGREDRVGNRLRQKDVHSWIPARKVVMVRSRGHPRPSAEVPAFPGYVLVEIVPSVAAFVGLSGVKDVERLISDGERPKPVPPRDMRALRALIASGVLDAGNEHLLKPELLALAVSDLVTIEAGPFSGFEATVVGIGEVARGFVDLEVLLFGQPTKLRRFPLACVRRIA